MLELSMSYYEQLLILNQCHMMTTPACLIHGVRMATSKKQIAIFKAKL